MKHGRRATTEDEMYLLTTPSEPPIDMFVTVRCTCPQQCAAMTMTVPVRRERGMSLVDAASNLRAAYEEMIEDNGAPKGSFKVTVKLW